MEVAEDIEARILDAIEDYETICVGTTREEVISQVLSSALPEQVGQRGSGTVAMARSKETSPRSIREAIIERLSS